MGNLSKRPMSRISTTNFCKAYPNMHREIIKFKNENNPDQIKSIDDLESYILGVDNLMNNNFEGIKKDLAAKTGNRDLHNLTQEHVQAPFAIANSLLEEAKSAEDESHIISVVNQVKATMQSLGTGSERLWSKRNNSSNDADSAKHVVEYFQLNEGLALGDVDNKKTLEVIERDTSELGTTSGTNGEIHPKEKEAILDIIGDAVWDGVETATTPVLEAISAQVANVSHSILNLFPKTGTMVLINETSDKFTVVDTYSHHGEGKTLTYSLPKAVILKRHKKVISTSATCALFECGSVGLFGPKFGLELEAPDKKTFSVAMGTPINGHNTCYVTTENAESAAKDVEKHGTDAREIYDINGYIIDARVSRHSGGDPQFLVRITKK